MTQTNYKRLYIKTYGCQMNLYDSDRMVEMLSNYGYRQSDNYEDADMVILNTCHIREKAAEKVYSELGVIQKFKEQRLSQGQEMIVVVAGCVAQAEGSEMMKRSKTIDIIVGPQNYQTLPKLISSVTRDKKLVSLDFDPVDKFDSIQKYKNSSINGFVTIQEGCDKFCTFCVVPYTRGAEYSRPVDDICNEIKRMVDNGTIEVTLLGQNVNAYHGWSKAKNREIDMGELIHEVAQIDGIQRIRYTTSHPKDMHESLYEAHGNVPNLMPFVHLPVQSGSNSILAKMNRHHDIEHYYNVIDKFKSASQGRNIQFSSDFIVGFPGETDQDFDDTLKLVNDIKFIHSFSFKYSPRPGTPAAMREDTINESVKSERLQILQAALNDNNKNFNLASNNQVKQVLFEKYGKDTSQLIGKTEHMQSVVAFNKSDLKLGQVYEVELNQTGANTFFGKVL